MKIQAKSGNEIEVQASPDGRGILIAIVTEHPRDNRISLGAELDINHCEALETALRAARLEVQALVLAP